MNDDEIEHEGSLLDMPDTMQAHAIAKQMEDEPAGPEDLDPEIQERIISHSNPPPREDAHHRLLLLAAEQNEALEEEVEEWKRLAFQAQAKAKHFRRKAHKLDEALTAFLHRALSDPSIALPEEIKAAREALGID